MSRKIKISAISDLHGNLPNPSFFEGGDVLCIPGDILPLDIQGNAVKSIAWFAGEFIPWTDSLPYNKVLVLFGNHDFFAQHIGPDHNNNGNDMTTLLLPGNMKGKHKVQILCDNGYKYMGFTFYGTSWCPDLSNWAFYGDHFKLKSEYEKIPDQVDVVLTHCPPRVGQAGMVLQKGWNWMNDFGCQELADAIQNRDIKWLLCGHVHTGDHHPFDFNGTKVVNVSYLDEDYRKSYNPFNFEIEK